MAQQKLAPQPLLQPVPIRQRPLAIPHGFPARDSLLTPSTALRRRPSYSTIETSRVAHYNLDFPEDADVWTQLLLDPKSRFYSRNRKRTIDLANLLPYSVEQPKDRARFLAHIVLHLYVAVQSLDIQGLLLITARDLAAVRDAAGLLAEDVALDTDLFELSGPQNDDDDDENGYFLAADDANSDTDAEEDDEDDDDEDDGTTAATSQHRRSPRLAAVVGVRIWTHELLVWLKMKYDMPVTLRAALARVYYAISVSRGQNLGLRTYVSAFELLTRDPELVGSFLNLPWEPLAAELQNHLSGPDALFEAFERKDHRQLLRLAERAAPFFPPQSLPDLYLTLGSGFSVANALLVLLAWLAMPAHFQGSKEDPNDIRHYIALLFHIWGQLTRSPGLDAHLTARLGTISMAFLVDLAKNNHSFGDFGVFSAPQVRFLLNTLVNSLSIMNEKYSSHKTKFFHGFALVLVFSMGPNADSPGNILDQLRTLVNAIESYVHPSNTGDWSRPIAKLVYSLVYQFHKRYNLEREKNGQLHGLPAETKLSDATTRSFVRTFLPAVRTGLQAKKPAAVDDYLTALGLLGHLCPEEVLAHILLDVYESLEGLISTHRVVIALRCMEELARYFASTPIFRVHLARIMALALPGIDSNDLEKTIHTLNTFAAISNYVPLHDLTSGNGDPGLAVEFTQTHLQYLEAKIYSDAFQEPFAPESSIELDALRALSASFKPLVKTLAERIFVLLENIPDPSKSTGVEKDLASCLPKFLFVMLEAMSEDIFKAFRKAVVDFISENTYHTIADVVGEICGGLIKRDPAYFKTLAPILIDKIRDDIVENGAGASRTGVDIVPRDQPLFWNLVILNECIGNAGEYVVSLGDDLNLLSLFLMDNVKGPAVFSSSYLLNQMLQATTKIRLKESRLVAPAYEAKNGVDEKCWGGFQFDEYRFSEENLTFDWFIPTEKEVRFAVDTFTTHVSRSLNNILNLMENYAASAAADAPNSLHVTDELRMNFLYLSYSLSGISFLFDPSFDEDIPKISKHDSESIQERLLLLKQIRGIKDTKSTGKDESRIENVYDNLQSIVNDIESDDLIQYMLDSDKLDDSFSHSLNDRFRERNDSSDSVHHPTSSIPKGRSHAFSKSDSPSPPVSESARATPQIGGFDMSSMNPGITFRERKLYTSRYYFGDDMETRRSSEMYLKIHKTRHLIGKSLHIIGNFMQTHFYDNTRLFKHFLYALNVWFSDVGRERILDTSHAKISFEYVSAMQHINRVRKPFTRILFGSRIESYHLLRVALHATSRTQTELDKLLLEDVVKLSFSTYSTIAMPAQATLVDAMKRLNGSYNVLARSSFKYLSKALDENNYQKIESGLSVFGLKRIKTKIQNDYFNLQKYVELLHRCLQVDNFEVNELAQKLFKGVYNSVTPPSSVCLLDSSEIDAIRPPDGYIDLEIRAVRLAKEKKRGVYLEKLQKLEDLVVTNEKHNGHWKITVLNLHLLIELQADLELPTNNEVFQLLAKESRSDHPVVARLALKGITKLVNKLYVLLMFDYDLKNAFNLNFIPRDLKTIDTSPTEGASYYQKWTDEMANVAHPSYFVDSKANTGWLFWGKSMLAVTNEPCVSLPLSENDSQVLRAFGNTVTKEWFLNVAKLWVTENEANSAFQGTDVFATATVLLLISNGYIEGFSFRQLLEVVEEIYVSDDKSSHIVICELLAGILIGAKCTSSAFEAERDDFICTFLTKIFDHDLSPDNRNIWNIFAWWVPAHVDCRRFPKVAAAITGFSINSDSDSAIKEATRLSYIRSFIAAVTWTYPSPDETLDMCLNNINHRYQAIREQVGSLLAILSFAYYRESISSAEEFARLCNLNLDKELYELNVKATLISRLPVLFEKIEAWRLEVEHLSPQEILKSDYIYSATTVLTWLKQALNTSIAVLYQDFADTYLVPFLLKLSNMKDVCQLGNIDPVTAFKKVSQIPFSTLMLERIVCMLEKYSKEDLNVVQSIIMGEFTETVFFKNIFCLSKEQRQRIINLTNTLVYHKNVEVREAAAGTLSGLIHTSPPDDVEELVSAYAKIYSSDLDNVRRKYKKIGLKNVSGADSIKLHGATLGLGALIHAFPFVCPPPKWVPSLLTMLGNKSSGIPGVVGKTAKDLIGRFKKNRQDTWHIDSKIFSENQMHDLEGVLWKSYFI